MTKNEYKQWLIQRLSEVEQTIDRPATAREAHTVYEAKRYAYKLGLLELANMMPERDLKTPLDCCLRLRECLEYLENPPSASVEDGALIGMKEAATILGYKCEGLRKLVDQGRIRFQQNGERGHIKFRREWLDEYIQLTSGGPESIDRSPAQRRQMPIAFDLRPGFDPSLFRPNS